jgi:hypothetical protein
MKVHELITLLMEFDPYAVVVADKYSDYSTIGEVKLLEVVPRNDYYQRVYGNLENDPIKMKVVYLEIT